MQRALVLLVATAVGPGCAGVRIVNAPEVAPRYQLETGSRVRVHLVQARGTVVGNVVRVTADSLIITPAETPLRETALSAANIGRLELSLGQRSRKGRGALVGLSWLAQLGDISHSCLSVARAASARGPSSASSREVRSSVRASVRESEA